MSRALARTRRGDVAGRGGRRCAADAVPVEPYFKHADYQDFKLSPSGKLAAGIVRVNGRSGLVGIDLATRKPGKVVAVNADEIEWFEWVNDERILFNVSERESGTGRRAPRPGLHRQARRQRIAGARAAAPARRAAASAALHALSVARCRTPPTCSCSPTTPTRATTTSIASIPRRGRKTLRSLEKPGNVVRWMADRDGALRLAVTDEETGGGKTFWRASESDPWQVVEEFKARGQRYAPVAFDGDGSLIVATRPKGDLAQLHRFDPATKQAGRDARRASAGRPRRRPRLRRPQEARRGRALRGRPPGHRVVRRGLGAHGRKRRPGIAGTLQPALARRRPERARVLVFGHGSRRVLPVRRASAASSTRLVSVRSASSRRTMPSRKLVRYPARDGLEIPAWLTLPRKADAEGTCRSSSTCTAARGCAARPGRGTTIAAYLATWATRCSSPSSAAARLGLEAHRSGWKQWGLAMQDDLDDGMDWLVKQGTIDPARACIMGAILRRLRGDDGPRAHPGALALRHRLRRRHRHRPRCSTSRGRTTRDSTYIKFVGQGHDRRSRRRRRAADGDFTARAGGARSARRC